MSTKASRDLPLGMGPKLNQTVKLLEMGPIQLALPRSAQAPGQYSERKSWLLAENA